MGYRVPNRPALNARGSAQRPVAGSNSLFSPGDPGLSFCDELLLGEEGIEAESAQPSSTVDVEEFTDLMLFPDLLGVFDDDLLTLKDFPIDPGSGDDDIVKPRQTISSTPGDGDLSPADLSPAGSDASVDHFFNTFTDLTAFLDTLDEEAGLSELSDCSPTTTIAESNDSFATTAVLSSTAAPTSPPTPVGPETMSGEGTESPRPHAHPTDDDDDDDDDNDAATPPPAKKARSSSQTPQEKYRRRRDKNNVASQRSRATRKQREKGMEKQTQQLEADNARLRVRIEELTAIAEEARKSLVEALSRK